MTDQPAFRTRAETKQLDGTLLLTFHSVVLALAAPASAMHAPAIFMMAGGGNALSVLFDNGATRNVPAHTQGPVHGSQTLYD